MVCVYKYIYYAPTSDSREVNAPNSHTHTQLKKFTQVYVGPLLQRIQLSWPVSQPRTKRSLNNSIPTAARVAYIIDSRKLNGGLQRVGLQRVGLKRVGECKGESGRRTLAVGISLI